MRDMHSRREYLKTLWEGYLKAKRRKEESQILDILWQYRSGKEVCHPENSATNKPGT